MSDPERVGADVSLELIDAGDWLAFGREHPSRTVTGMLTLEIEPELLRCECGNLADAVHFGRTKDGGGEAVSFSCPEHDFGGYYVMLARLLDPDEDFVTHILDKGWGLEALAVLSARLWELRQDAYRDWLIAKGIDSA